MPRCVVALLVAFGLAGLAGAVGGSAATASGIDAAGQAFLTFDFGSNRVERRGPRFGLRVGLQGDRAPGTAEPEPFVSAMSLGFAATGPAELSLGGLTVPLDINPFGSSEDDGGGDRTPQDVAPEPAPLITTAGATNWANEQSLEALIAPGAGHAAQAQSQTQRHESPRWRFHALSASPARAGETAADRATAFALRSGHAAGRIEHVVERGAWRFRSQESGRQAPASSRTTSLARLLLPHHRAADRAWRDNGPLRSAGHRWGNKDQVVRAGQLARAEGERPQNGATRQGGGDDRWVFRRIVLRQPSHGGMIPAAFEANHLRPKRRRLPNR